MKTAFSFVAVLSAFVAFAASVEIGQDRPDALYRSGDETVFTVSVKDDSGALLKSGKAKWTLDNFGSVKYSSGAADLSKGNPFTVKGKMDEEGFLRLCVNSGTNSVFVALHALDLPPFSEVIVGPVTDPGGIMPIVMLNCIPVVADAEPGSFNTGAAQVEACITPRTSAIVIPHIGGAPADIKAIMKVAKKHKLPVVEDCAQAHGASVDGQKVGTFGTYGAFSLMFGKHFCAGGQGGAIFSKTEDLYWQERRAADRGKPFGLEGHTNVRAAINCNMDEFGAAIGRAQLKKLPQIIAKRQAFVKMLMNRGIADLDIIKIPKLPKGAEHTYWWWRLELNLEKMTVDKFTFCKALAAEGVPINPHYIGALPWKQEWFQNREKKHPWNNPLYKGKVTPVNCPNAEEAVNRCFLLMVEEGWGAKEADAFYKALAKLNAAFKK